MQYELRSGSFSNSRSFPFGSSVSVVRTDQRAKRWGKPLQDKMCGMSWRRWKRQHDVGKSMKIRDFHSADVQKQTDAQLTDMITTGKGAIPAYKGKLAEDQIKQLVAYIRDLK
jgi:hypothetical protein